jgi:uncharacterized protein YdaL
MHLPSNYLRMAAVFILMSCLTVAASRVGTAAAATLPSAEVLIVHDSLPGPMPAGVIDGNNVMDLLGHFGLKGNLIAIDEYKAGDINKYKFVVVLAVDARKLVYPRSFISDIHGTNLPVYWVGRHWVDLQEDAQFNDRIGFRVSGPGIPQGFDRVSYKGKLLFKGDPFLFPIEVFDSSKAQIIATAQDASGRIRPYIVHGGNYWYTGDTPFGFAREGDRYLVFCDLLHDFFRVPHEEERRALLRLEDISVEEDADNLKSLADYLYERKVPFQISLVPIYVDPENHQEIYLSDRPKFADAIRYMGKKGGMVVMHGITHQFRGKSTDDYEFWDEASRKPVPGDSPELVEKKLRLGIEECFKNGIYPITWETPHYVASLTDYKTLARYFNSAYEREGSLNRADSGHYFPYSSVDRFGRFIIPESLGYIAMEKPDPAALVANADRMQVVRDGMASFFFHPFLNREYLKQCLDGIEGLGYKFVSIRDFDLRLQMDDHFVQTYTAAVRLPIQGRYLHRFYMHDNGRISSESYSQRKLDTIVHDPGMVPADAILVMEGVDEVEVQLKPAGSPGLRRRFFTWIQDIFSPKIPPGYILRQPQAMVLWDDSLTRGDWSNQKSYVSALSTVGFIVSSVQWQDFSLNSVQPDEVLIVPSAVAVKLPMKQIQQIQEFVRKGGRLVLDGPSPLCEGLGIRFDRRPLKVQKVDDTLFNSPGSPSGRAQWNPPAEVRRYSAPNSIQTFAKDAESEIPVAKIIACEKGRLLYLSTRLDPNTPLGYTRFPYFVHYVMKGFNLRLPLQRDQIEFYFDGGADHSDPDRLAQRWRESGVRAIYLAASTIWPAWSFNYQHFIDVCHKNGILVYAWFELPHVNPKFWEDHPEWRAKSASGEDGLVGWRHHMDLDIPECREAAFLFVEEMIRKYPWDGVNIAELNFDTEGPENPRKYLPMGATTRVAFKKLNKFDPIQLFNPKSQYYWKDNPGALGKFENYRSQCVLEWHKAILERITPIARERDIEIIVTMLDSLHSRTVTRDTGMDSRKIVPLMDQFPFTLQVEDPAHFWGEGPDRYKKFTATYLNLVRDRRRLMFDINVVERDLSHSHSPSKLQIGTELAISLIEASQASGRVGIFSASTVPFDDQIVLSSVLAHNARVERRGQDSWVTVSDRSVSLNAPGQWQNFLVDDHIWPGWGENFVFIPAGTHRITPVEKRYSLLSRVIDTSILDFRMIRFTGNLDYLMPTDRGMQFSYDSYLPTLALFNRQPFVITIDGRESDQKAVPNAGVWSVRLPRGRHNVGIVADSAATVILDTTSLYSSALIVIFGGVAVGLMVLIYLAILARRVIGRAVGRSTTSLTTHS